MIIGWALASVTSLCVAATAGYRQRKAAAAARVSAARLILEELRIAQRAVEGEDTSRFIAGIALPTDVWNQRRERLAEVDTWQVIADAFAAIDDLNAARTAQLMWRTETTREQLSKARDDARGKLPPAENALRTLAEG